MSEDLLSLLTAFTYRRQMLGQAAANPDDALARLVGVYSSHPSAPLTLAARVRGLTAEAFTALDREKRALRLPAMRGSIHLLPRATAHLAAATPMFEGGYEYYVKHGHLTEADYFTFREQALTVVQTPMSVDDVRQATGSTHKLVPEMLKFMCREGLLLRIGSSALSSNALQYVSAQAWLGAPLPQTDASSALIWLAEQYLRAYGPARTQDFAWWAGVKTGAAKTALAALETVQVETSSGTAQPMWILAEDEDAFRTTEPLMGDEVDLLPKWDMYTMGYPRDGRERFIKDDQQPRIYSEAGDGYGLLLIGGRAAGRWDVRLSGAKMQVDLQPFAPLAAPTRVRIDERLDSLRALMNMRTLVLKIS